MENFSSCKTFFLAKLNSAGVYSIFLLTMMCSFWELMSKAHHHHWQNRHPSHNILTCWHLHIIYTILRDTVKVLYVTRYHTKCVKITWVVRLPNFTGWMVLVHVIETANFIFIPNVIITGLLRFACEQVSYPIEYKTKSASNKWTSGSSFIKFIFTLN